MLEDFDARFDVALSQCPKCGGKVSTLASACPHCGYSVADAHTSSDSSNERVIAERSRRLGGVEATPGKKQVEKLVVLLALATLVIICVIAFLHEMNRCKLPRIEADSRDCISKCDSGLAEYSNFCEVGCLNRATDRIEQCIANR